eukprot:6845629-Alexandrium_andersonii.AAC.1
MCIRDRRHLAHHGIGAIELRLRGLDGALVLVVRRRSSVVGLSDRVSGGARRPVRRGVPVPIAVPTTWGAVRTRCAAPAAAAAARTAPGAC